MVVSRAGKRGGLGFISRVEFQLCQMKSLLEMDDSDGCITLWMYLKALNVHLKIK